MTRLEDHCRARRAGGRKMLVPFLTAGFPDERTSLDLLAACLDQGCEVVEVGVPFSDPVADGPVIQQASQAALDRGMTLLRSLDLVRELSTDKRALPVMMTYLNPVLRLGFGAFARAAAAAGCAGVIVPDMSVEEAGPLREALRREGVALVDLAAPTTTDARLGRIAGGASGFLYLVAVAGVTGTRSADPAALAAFTARVRGVTDLPLYVGFGIDNGDRAAEAAAAADGVIVGSALIRRLLDAPTGAAGRQAVLSLLAELDAGLGRAAERSQP